MTLTFCDARIAVVAAKLSLLLRRAYVVTKAEHANNAGISRNQSSRFPFVCEDCVCWFPEGNWSLPTKDSNCVVIKSSRILWSQVLRFFLIAHHGENDENKEESCDCGEEQPANYRTVEGSILFASLAASEGHGHHADYHSESGHHNRP